MRGVRVTALAVALLALAPARSGAREPFADCLALEPARRGSCIYHLARRQQLWQQGAEHLRELLADQPGDAHAAFNLARLELDTGDTELAAGLFAQAAGIFEERGEATYEAYSRLNLGECLRLGNLPAEAAEQFELAGRLAAEAGLTEVAAEARLAALGLDRQRGHDLEHLYRRFRELEGELGTAGYGVQRTFMHQLSAVLLGLHRLDEMLAVNRRWAELARAEGHGYDEAAATVNMATASSEMPGRRGARDEALGLAEKGLGLARAEGHKFAEIEALRLLGMLLPGEQGRAHLRQCLDLGAAGSLERSLCHFALAGSLAAKRPEEAAARLDQALAEVLAIENPWAPVYAWSERFRVTWATRPRPEALADSLAVLDLIEALRRLQDGEQGRVDFFAGWVEVYQALVGRLLEAPGGPSRTELEAAFRITERMRARLLLDGLAEAGARPSPDPELAAERTATLRRIIACQRRLQAPGLEVRERRALLDELADAELRLDDLDRHDADFRPDDAGAFADLHQIESLLGDQQALFVYQLAPDHDVFGKPAGGSWLLLIHGGGSRLHRLAGGRQLEAKVAMLLGLVEGRGPEAADPRLIEQVAEALFAQLLEPAVADLPADVRDWIVVPDGPLHLLPFGLLAPEARLSTVPSATLWRHWRSSARAVPAAALAFADPAVGGAAPARAGSSLERDVRLDPLPHARREGRRLVRRVGGASRLLVGEQASEHALRQIPLGDFGIVHFAAHAVLDPRRPRRSAIVLAAGGEHVDGLLQPRDITGLDLAGRLVVLSACQSAAGRRQLGEGVDSLARAFFRAGARAVVASPWRLRDDEAAAFFDHFYAQLGRGESLAAAVASARRARRAAGAPPAAWAGVVVLGDGAWAPLAAAEPSSYGARGVAAAALALLLFLAAATLSPLHRRRRARLRSGHPPGSS